MGAVVTVLLSLLQIKSVRGDRGGFYSIPDVKTRMRRRCLIVPEVGDGCLDRCRNPGSAESGGFASVFFFFFL